MTFRVGMVDGQGVVVVDRIAVQSHAGPKREMRAGERAGREGGGAWGDHTMGGGLGNICIYIYIYIHIYIYIYFSKWKIAVWR